MLMLVILGIFGGANGTLTTHTFGLAAGRIIRMNAFERSIRSCLVAVPFSLFTLGAGVALIYNERSGLAAVEPILPLDDRARYSTVAAIVSLR